MLTVESLVDRIEPYLRRAIDAEVPFALRWVAHKLARWKIRKTIQLAIALYGHQVTPVLASLMPVVDRLFKTEAAAAVRDIKALCELQVSDLGAGAFEARREAGPSPAVLRQPAP